MCHDIYSWPELYVTTRSVVHVPLDVIESGVAVIKPDLSALQCSLRCNTTSMNCDFSPRASILLLFIPTPALVTTGPCLVLDCQ